MINILSVGCSLAFATYILDQLEEFIARGTAKSMVVRQGGLGLIIRPDEGLAFRHQNRESVLKLEEACHYLQTVLFRKEFYRVSRTADEVVLSNVGQNVLLSHPQSEIWLDRQSISYLTSEYRNSQIESATAEELQVSAAGDRLLVSDKRTGRWVFLGGEQVEELERRGEAAASVRPVGSSPKPPRFELKGVSVAIQSSLRLLEALRAFGDNKRVEQFEEITPAYRLAVSHTSSGLEVSDFNTRVAVTSAEARKWAALLESETDRLDLKVISRGAIRTAAAETEDGTWILQWGDEVFIPQPAIVALRESGPGDGYDASDVCAWKKTGSDVLVLSKSTGACVALKGNEFDFLPAT